MTLYEKIKTMSLLEMIDEFEKVTVWARNLSKYKMTQIDASPEGLRGFIKDALEKEYKG